MLAEARSDQEKKKQKPLNPFEPNVAINRTKSRCQLSDYPRLSDDCGQAHAQAQGRSQRRQQGRGGVRWLDKLSITAKKATASVSFNVRHMARHERNADASFADQFQNRTGHWPRQGWVGGIKEMSSHKSRNRRNKFQCGYILIYKIVTERQCSATSHCNYKYIIYSFHLAAQRWHLPDDARRARARGQREGVGWLMTVGRKS